ncbi:PqiC family protein [Burkholderia cenocepacia]|uniref:PqiC family protein n=1 Tax=Burkholderia cenocepacia TaxID=95486 RepID=UPI001F45A284|nr:PqiC family protein [Burkholderia cenocepacia]MCF1369282.1 PqiC family protein [Burkholderia cenocepacia]MCF1386687.1 PqiC family protein [Burkholderia cenocepacia]
MTTRVNGFASGAAAAFAVLALAACSSPPARFYTLSPADAAAPVHTAPANPPFLIEVPSVGVPEQVARNQLVVQKNAAQVDVLEQERWASPPADEIRRALSDDLAARLGTIDVANSATPPGVPVYRISVNVQRFESWPGKRAAVDAVWSVRSLATQAVMTCRTSVAEPVDDGYDALVVGHRRALAALASQITGGIEAMETLRTRFVKAPVSGQSRAVNLSASTVPCLNLSR